MKINATIKPTSLTEEEAVNIKGGINSQSVAIASSCTGIPYRYCIKVS